MSSGAAGLKQATQGGVQSDLHMVVSSEAEGGGQNKGGQGLQRGGDKGYQSTGPRYDRVDQGVAKAGKLHGGELYEG